MIPTSGDIQKRQREIEGLVGDDDLDGASNRLIDFVNDFSKKTESRHDAIVVKACYRDVERSKHTIDRDKYVQEKTKVRYQLLGLLTTVVEGVARDGGVA